MENLLTNSKAVRQLLLEVEQIDKLLATKEGELAIYHTFGGVGTTVKFSTDRDLRDALRTKRQALKDQLRQLAGDLQETNP